jgi:hypothetical protein
MKAFLLAVLAGIFASVAGYVVFSMACYIWILPPDDIGRNGLWAVYYSVLFGAVCGALFFGMVLHQLRSGSSARKEAYLAAAAGLLATVAGALATVAVGLVVSFVYPMRTMELYAG